jgi:predicted  nucleic acid-binding Zn-ribbon protein
MSTDTVEIDQLVAEAVEKIRSRGEKVTARSVQRETGRRGEDVCRALKRFLDKERAAAEARIAMAISPNIGAEIIKDREAYAAAQTEILQEDIEHLEGNCEVLDDEVVKLRAELEDLEGRLTSESTTNTGKIKTLELSNSHLDGALQVTQGQTNTLRSELETANKQRDDAAKKLSGVRETLGRRSAEAKAESTKANRFQKQAEKAQAERDAAQASLETAQKASEQLQGQVTALTSQLDQLHKEIASETQTHVETLQANLAALINKDSTPAPLSKTSSKKTKVSKKPAAKK